MSKLLTIEEQHQICYIIGEWYLEFKQKDINALFLEKLCKMISKDMSLSYNTLEQIKILIGIWYLKENHRLPKWLGHSKEILKELLCEAESSCQHHKNE